ncbi:hypothetical protein QTN47_16025 [Danxiaibacter flavus]|uniref:Uncharacterized protein n=1 Tax=Danxiaibacter flavus TaxID=3049108 RepID=A0ABV3ZGI9_9BACT|nr:hypothetical protein QNM32_16035 [Chitinophagaceae bacterium DXS]
MKISVEYLKDNKGNPNAVKLPLVEWEKLLLRLRKYEQTLKIRSDLKEAFEEVALLKRTRSKKQTLKEFLNEL